MKMAVMCTVIQQRFGIFLKLCHERRISKGKDVIKEIAIGTSM